ncbi:hypothetical protein ASE63_25020 [Bosea sp. Root381]|nr:hypothetical protein ASE63_25020 [Bosea sp. Root381]
MLQWHSLLSGLDGVAYQDLRFRMLADGLFHAVMYGVGLIGLGMLFMARRDLSVEGSGRTVIAAVFVGFGCWHLLDAVLNHWILGLHHIREGSPNWLVWDLAFFALGLALVAAGLWVGRPNQRLPGPPIGTGRAFCLAVLTTGTGIAAATPLTSGSNVTVVFSRTVPPAEVISAMAAIDGQLVWAAAEANIWTFAVPDRRAAWQLYGRGAVLVSGSMFGMGCFSSTPPDGIYPRSGPTSL